MDAEETPTRFANINPGLSDDGIPFIQRRKEKISVLHEGDFYYDHAGFNFSGKISEKCRIVLWHIPQFQRNPVAFCIIIVPFLIVFVEKVRYNKFILFYFSWEVRYGG